MSQQISLTKKFEFSASHRYWREDWSKEKNERIFGNCTSPYGHGHNYELHVTVIGHIDPHTGMIINLSDLKARVKEIVDAFDHKFLNLDTPYFKKKVPTTENIAIVLFELIDERLKPFSDRMQLQRVRLYERNDLYADVWRNGQ
jgi:6-pyruvoyltetrahydropterin/6-carboxytetrahydropterin synthase